MTRGKFVVGAFVAVFAAGAISAEAQRTGAGAASRDPGSSAERTGGSAVPRDSGGSSGGSSAGSSSSGSGSTGSAGSSGSSGGGWSAPSAGSGSRSRSEYNEAPSHPSERQQTRQRGEGASRPSGGEGGGRAVPRDSGGITGAGSTTRGAAASADNDQAPSRRAVPTYSRPRDGRAATGTAVERDFPRPDRDGGFYGSPYYGAGYNNSFYYSPYRRYYYVPSYGFGLGYLYDPLWYDPYYDGYGYGGGYGGGGYGSGYYGGSGRSSYARGATGSLRLKIKPREAKVYVDGYFVGDVDNFDGLFQRLGIDAGGHKIEVRADGYEPIQFDVLLAPGETVTYKGELKRP
jgi:PEGA domain